MGVPSLLYNRTNTIEVSPIDDSDNLVQQPLENTLIDLDKSYSVKPQSINQMHDISRWILEDRVTSDGSSVGGQGRSIVYDEDDRAFYVFYFDKSNCADFTSLCVNKLNLINDTWSGKFKFNNNIYVAGENWNNNQYFEQHIVPAVTIDNYNH